MQGRDNPDQLKEHEDDYLLDLHDFLKEQEERRKGESQTCGDRIPAVPEQLLQRFIHDTSEPAHCVLNAEHTGGHCWAASCAAREQGADRCRPSLAPKPQALVPAAASCPRCRHHVAAGHGQRWLTSWLTALPSPGMGLAQAQHVRAAAGTQMSLLQLMMEMMMMNTNLQGTASACV